jgi:glutamyl-tRNA reductase
VAILSAITLPHISLVGETSAHRETWTSSESPSEPLFLFGFEISLRTASLDALEDVARTITSEWIHDQFSRFQGTEEIAVLTTCHRVEFALLAQSAEEVDRWRAVLPGDPDSWHLREGRAEVHHLFRVAAGCESLARGEAEVRDQVRAAGRQVETRHPRPVLRELFAGAADFAEQAHPSVPPAQSIAAIAASQLLRLVDRPSPRVLVIGSGTVGRQIAENLASAAQVTMIFHEKAPAVPFLRAVRARASPLSRLTEELADADAVVTAAKFGNHGLHASDLPRDHPLVLVDLGMPRNIEPSVRTLPNVRLVDLEELHGKLGALSPVNDQDTSVEEAAGRFSDRLQLLLLEPWVDKFRRAAEELRRSELANARALLGKLDPEQELVIERLTMRLVARLLLAPTQRIRSLPTGPEGDLQRRFAIELLRPLPGVP